MFHNKGASPRTAILRKLAALPLAAALLLAGCASESTTGGNAPTSAMGADPDGGPLRIISNPDLTAEWQAENFKRNYEQNIKWRECGPKDGLIPEVEQALEAVNVNTKEVKCGSIAAPLDWTDPENLQSVELAVVHIPSTGDKPKGTLLGNPGGPGATGRDFMIGMTVSPGFDKLLAEYDLLGFDPRGIGASQPIQCQDSEYTNSTLRIGDCIGKNPLAHYMGTSSVARDMELMRALMKDDKLNYLGYSYGTMLGATYATLFQDKVGRMVLDSAEDAGWATPIHRFEQQVAISRAIVHLGQTCEAEYTKDGTLNTCPFVDEQSVADLIKKLDEQPLHGDEGATVTGHDVYSYLTSTLYRSAFDRKISMAALNLALEGDGETIKLIADSIASGGAAVDTSGTIVTCHSFPNDPDIPGLLEHVNRIGMPLLLGGPDIDEQNLSDLADLGCFALPESGHDIYEEFHAPNAAPILVIGITGDHTTPFQYAEALNKQLETSTLLTVDAQGHAASFQGRSSCVDDKVVTYFLDGTLPAAGTVCEDDPVEESEQNTETETAETPTS